MAMAATAALALHARAEVPGLVSVQGRLTDSAGGAVDGVLTCGFDIYDVATGGSPVWSETQDVTFAGGVFTVALGSASALDAGLFDAADLWLEMTVAGETLDPRFRLMSVPYAMRAGGAAALGGHDETTRRTSRPPGTRTSSRRGRPTSPLRPPRSICSRASRATY
jgi:hypothetical protein